MLDLSTKSGEKLLERTIRQNQLIFSEIEGVCILNTQGEILFSTFYHESEKMNEIRANMVEKHLEQQLSFCSQPFVDHNEQYLSLSRSVTDASGNIARIVTLIIQTDHFHEELNLTSIPGAEQMILSDAEDSIVTFWANDSPIQRVP